MEQEIFWALLLLGKDTAYPDDKICVLGINPAGKGTPGYKENQERLGAFGYKAMLAEHKALIEEARASFPDFFAGDATLLLHSMAGAYGLPQMENLTETDSLDHVILYSTVGSGPLTGINVPLLVNVRRQILPALGQTLSGRGSIDLSLEERAKLMGEGSREAQAQVPASGKEFFTWALGSKRVSKELKEELEADTVTVDLVLGEDDALIPFGMSRDSAWALGRPYTEFIHPKTPHSLPLEMTEEQIRSWVYIFSRKPEELDGYRN